MNAIGKRISVLLLVCMLLRCGGLPALAEAPEETGPVKVAVEVVPPDAGSAAPVVDIGSGPSDAGSAGAPTTVGGAESSSADAAPPTSGASDAGEGQNVGEG